MKNLGKWFLKVGLVLSLAGGNSMLSAQSLEIEQTPSSSSVYVWNDVVVKATPINISTPIDSVVLSFTFTSADAGFSGITNTLKMVETSGSYSTTIKSLTQGSLDYKVTAFAGEQIVVESGVQSVYVSHGDTGNTARFADGTLNANNWVNSGGTVSAGNTAVCQVLGDEGEPTAWSIAGGRVITAGLVTARALPKGAVRPVMQLYNVSGASLVSPRLAYGVGTVYFTSATTESTSGAKISIRYSYVDDPTENDWLVADNFTYPETGTADANPNLAVAFEINNRNIRRISIYRNNETELASGQLLGDAINFDDIMISMPSAKIGITEELKNPGYPSRYESTFIRCTITNEMNEFPAINKKVTLWYKWSKSVKDFEKEGAPPMEAGVPQGEGAVLANGWAWTNMVLKSGSEVETGTFEAEIPPQRQGEVFYFFRCDFDGYYYERSPDGGTTAPNVTKVSPTYLPDLETNTGLPQNRVLQFDVRAFRSQFEGLSVDSDVTPIPAYEMKLVGDYTWQGVTSVKDVLATSWIFTGHAAYTNDASAYASTNWFFGQPETVSTNPPLSGAAILGDGTEFQARLKDNEDGLMLFRLNTQNGDYVVKRAVYQDFNDWQASYQYYEESIGLYKVQDEATSFETWDADEYTMGDIRSEAFVETEADGFSTLPRSTWHSWVYQNGEVLAERYVRQAVNNGAPFITTNMNNKAVSLDALGGGIWLTLPPNDFTPGGLETIMLNARASLDTSTVLLDNSKTRAMPLLYRGSTGAGPYENASLLSKWESSLTLVTYATVATLSDAKDAGFSILVAYDTFNDKYYEVRIMQRDSVNREADDRMAVEVWRWDGSTLTRLGERANDNRNRTLKQKYAISEVSPSVEACRYVVKLNYNTAGKTIITVQYGTTTSPRESSYNFEDTNPAGMSKIGTFGYHAKDAELCVKGAAVYDSVDDFSFTVANPFVRFSGTATESMFSYDSNQWTYDGGNQGVKTKVLPQRYAVYLGDVPTGAKTPDLSQLEYYNSYTVGSLAWAAMPPISVKTSPKQFVWICRSSNGSSPLELRHPVVLDELVVNPWRARTRGGNGGEGVLNNEYYYDWTSPSQQDVWLRSNQGQQGWSVLEGWIKARGVGDAKEVVFEGSRAQADFVQAIVSPLMTNGVGSIVFDWKVENGAMTFVTEVSSDIIQDQWDPVYTNVAASGQGDTTYVPVRLESVVDRRIRVRVMEATSPSAKLTLWNLVARGYPPRDATSWMAYNVLITGAGAGTLPVDIEQAILEPIDGTRTAFLNNSPTDETNGQNFNDDEPYVQTPLVETGIGEIAFWYRNFDPQGRPAKLVLKVAPSLDTPGEFWTELDITQLTSGDRDKVAALDSITNTEYEYITIMPFDRYNKALRIYCEYSAERPGRVAIDNVLMAEPMRAGFSIMGMQVFAKPNDTEPYYSAHQSRYPAQPLVAQNVGVEVYVGNFLMTPSNINVYVTYQTGTNTWGVNNWLTSEPGWWTNRVNAGNTIQLQPVDGRVDLYSSTASQEWIPGRSQDDVVQYIAWGDHQTIREMNAEPIILDRFINEQPAFTNPEWYGTVNLNERYGGPEGENWAPYYFVYSCPPRSVLINEFFYFYNTGDRDYEFVELIGPADTSISGWKVEFLKNNSTIPSASTRYQTLEPSQANTSLSARPEDNGWGFYVWGAEKLEPRDAYFDNITPGMSPQNGTLTLYRSNGIVEHALSYGTGIDQRSIEGYTWIGSVSGPNPLSLVNAPGVSTATFLEDLNWTYLVARTPSAINNSQILADITYDSPGETTFAIRSTVSRGDGGFEGSTQVALGSRAQVAYTAGKWSRIASLNVNENPVTAAVGKKEYVWNQENVSGNYDNVVAFEPVDLSPIPSTWLQTVDDRAGDLPLAEETTTRLQTSYLLAIADPWEGYDPEFHASDVQPDAATVMVRFVLENQNLRLNDINGQLQLWASDDLVEWSLVDSLEVGVPINTQLTIAADGAFEWQVPRITDEDKKFFKLGVAFPDGN